MYNKLLLVFRLMVAYLIVKLQKSRILEVFKATESI